MAGRPPRLASFASPHPLTPTLLTASLSENVSLYPAVVFEIARLLRPGGYCVSCPLAKLSDNKVEQQYSFYLIKEKDDFNLFNPAAEFFSIEPLYCIIRSVMVPVERAC